MKKKPLHKKILKSLERFYQLAFYTLINKKDHSIEGFGKNYFYLRSHCALYRTDYLKKYHLTFNDNDEVAGKVMHKKLLEHGHKMVFLKEEELLNYLDHINHATMIINPEFNLTKRARKQGEERMRKFTANETR